MIAVYSSDSCFNAFIEKVVTSVGIIPIFFEKESDIGLFEEIKTQNFLIFQNNYTKPTSERIAEILYSKFPSANIASAVQTDAEEEGMKFREISGITKQINLPCDESIFRSLLFRYFSFVSCVNILAFENDTGKVSLLGYPLPLSKKEYYILRSLSANAEVGLSADVFDKIFKLSKNCLSTHVCNINKKAYDITGRKLIVYSNQRYTLNPDM